MALAAKAKGIVRGGAGAFLSLLLFRVEDVIVPPAWALYFEVPTFGLFLVSLGVVCYAVLRQQSVAKKPGSRKLPSK
ncbi:hypothetical protein EB232_22285 [Mesorhizobium sp. NZP2077]|nr:hypothetical protein EB232_22285 [Mesorhizobium sp. NZP2077]